MLNALFQKFYQSVIKKPSKNLKSLHSKALNAPATNYCLTLQEIAEAQRFEVLYNDIPELNSYGKYVNNYIVSDKQNFVEENRVHTGLKSTWIFRTVLKNPWK